MRRLSRSIKIPVRLTSLAEAFSAIWRPNRESLKAGWSLDQDLLKSGPERPCRFAAHLRAGRL